MKRRLWVVECWDDVMGWRPAIEAELTKRSGMRRLRAWRERYFDRTDKFRLVPYEPRQERGK